MLRKVWSAFKTRTIPCVGGIFHNFSFRNQFKLSKDAALWIHRFVGYRHKHPCRFIPLLPSHLKNPETVLKFDEISARQLAWRIHLLFYRVKFGSLVQSRD
jgi:hypothetical protein